MILSLEPRRVIMGMAMGTMGTMGMGIRRGLGELGPFLFVVRRRAPVFGIQVRGLGDIVFLRALLDGLPLVLRRRNLGLARLIHVLCDGR